MGCYVQVWFHIVALYGIMAAHGYKALLAEAGGSCVEGEVRSLAFWRSSRRQNLPLPIFKEH